MKKFVAMMMVILMMICGVASAEEPTTIGEAVVEVITSITEMEPTETGSISFIKLLYDLEVDVPSDVIYGEVFDDCGYIIEYADHDGNHYYWLGEGDDYAYSCSVVLVCQTLLYNNDLVYGCIFSFGPYLYGLSPAEDSYNDASEFATAMALKLAIYMNEYNLKGDFSNG